MGGTIQLQPMRTKLLIEDNSGEIESNYKLVSPNDKFQSKINISFDKKD